MTALAFDDRYQTTTPALSTDPQAVDFEIFSTTDLEVFVNGVETTDFTISATFIDGVSINAVVTIITPVATSPTVEIVGVREPRRDQFLTAAGTALVAAMNSDLARRAAENQEARRDVDLALKLPFLDAFNKTLPSASVRASSYFFFDSDGRPTTTAGAPPTNLGQLATKAALVAATVSPGITIIFLSGHLADGDGGAAYWKKVGSDPTHNLKITSADGAFWEVAPWNSIIQFQTCGGKEGDVAGNGAANVTAFNDFIGYAQAFFVDGITADGPTLQFPKGDYHFNDHLNVKAAVIIQGAGGFGEGVRTASVMHFAAEQNGIIVQNANTIDEVTVASTFTGTGAIIEGLHLIGGGFGNTNGHGIWLRARAMVRNCFVTQFGEDGIRIVANVASGGETEGNSNLWRLEGCLSKRNGRHGYFIDDADANAGYAFGCDAALNARWGFFDSSLLGNTYDACHTQSNGVANTAGNGADASSYVSFGSNRYSANVDATEAQLVATTPGTDETIWILRGSGGVGSNIPLWVAAKPTGTYFHGGAYHTDGVGASCLFDGCYREDDQGENQVLAPSAIFQGEMHSNKSSGYYHKGITTGAQITGQTTYDNTATFFKTSTRAILGLNVNRSLEKLLRLEIGASDFIGVVGWDEADDVMLIGEYNNSSTLRPIRITSATTALSCGRASTLGGGELILGMGVFIGDSRSNARHMTNGTAAPTTGEHAQGEIVWNRSASVGAPLCWICVNSGTPGTWAEVRSVADQTTGADQAALTNSTGGSADGTMLAVPAGGAGAAAGGWDTAANRDLAITAINKNITELHLLLDEIRTTLVANGMMKGSA